MAHKKTKPSKKKSTKKAKAPARKAKRPAAKPAAVKVWSCDVAAAPKRAAPISDQQISRLAVEADAAGDREMVKICGKALTGNKRARQECSRVIMAARAMM